MEISRPQFSILIPTTGRVYLVRVAVESVLRQSFDSFEVIIADSGESIETRQAVADFKDARIRYVVTPDHDPSLGWDYAAKQASGEYFLWLDDDNYLLPFALEVFRGAIARTHAEIITANHLYYYDGRYPRHYLRNSIGVVPFTGGERPIELDEVLRAIYALGRRGSGSPLPRLHPAATIFSRCVAERAIARLGCVQLPHMRTNQSIQPILYAHARSCFFLDRPVSIVGRLSASVSQDWSKSARQYFKKVPFAPTCSPVTGDTRTNNAVESLLRAKRALPDLLDFYPLDYDRFLGFYVWELFFLDTSAGAMFRNWRNLFGFLKILSPKIQQKFRFLVWMLAIIAPFLYMVRRIRLHRLWRLLRGSYVRFRERGAKPKELWKGTREFTISLDRWGIDSFSTLGMRISEVIRAEIGVDIGGAVERYPKLS